MPSRLKLRGPAAAADIQAAAKDFVDVANGEGDVIQAAFAIGQWQEKDVVVPSVRTLFTSRCRYFFHIKIIFKPKPLFPRKRLLRISCDLPLSESGALFSLVLLRVGGTRRCQSGNARS